VYPSKRWILNGYCDDRASRPETLVSSGIFFSCTLFISFSSHKCAYFVSKTIKITVKINIFPKIATFHLRDKVGVSSQYLQEEAVAATTQLLKELLPSPRDFS